LENGLDIELNAFAELFETDEQREGTTAFVEKRKPNFRS
jgi:enoyl-CoA hydratase